VREAAVLAGAVAALKVSAGIVAGRRSAIVTADAAGDVLGPSLALSLVVGLVVLHARALLQHVAVGDGGEVAEDVLAAALGGDEA
jgi:hypothetical protein